MGPERYPFLSNGVTETRIIGPSGFDPRGFSDNGFIVGDAFDPSLAGISTIGFGYDTLTKTLSYYGIIHPSLVNTQGQVVGVYNTDTNSGEYFGLFFSPDRVTTINLEPLVRQHFAPLRNGFSFDHVGAQALSNNGLVAANISHNGNPHAFMFNVNDIAIFGLSTPIIDYGLFTYLHDLNNNGKAVGRYCPPVGPSPSCSPIITDDAGFQLLNGDFFAAAINDAGQIVGHRFVVGENGDRAIFYVDGVLNYLKDLVSPTDPLKELVVLEQAVDINDTGEVLVQGYILGGLPGFQPPVKSFLLKPTLP